LSDFSADSFSSARALDVFRFRWKDTGFSRISEALIGSHGQGSGHRSQGLEVEVWGSGPKLYG